MDGVVGLVIPEWLCRSCRDQLDVVVVRPVPEQAPLAERIVLCAGCEAERSRSSVVAQPGTCGGCGWRGPLAVIESGDYRTAPICLTCRMGLRSVLRRLRRRWTIEAA